MVESAILRMEHKLCYFRTQIDDTEIVVISDGESKVIVTSNNSTLFAFRGPTRRTSFKISTIFTCQSSVIYSYLSRTCSDAYIFFVFFSPPNTHTKTPTTPHLSPPPLLTTTLHCTYVSILDHPTINITSHSSISLPHQI